MSIQIVDQTPFQDEKGRIDLIGQVQGRLKYGLSWMGDVKAQQQVIAMLGKQLDHSYTVLHNVPLPGTEVLLPLVLTGPSGIFLINVTNMRGVYRARGDEWGTVDGVNFKAAPVNLVMRTMRLAAGLQKFLERQGFAGMIHVEGILMTAHPGMIVDSIRPAIRIVMSDALDRFAISLGQARNVLSVDAAHNIADRIVNPVQPKPEPIPASAAPASAPQERAGAVPTYVPQGLASADNPPQQQDLNAESFGFSFSDDAASQGSEPAATGVQPFSQKDQDAPAAAARRAGGGLKLSTAQWIILGVMALCWICSMIGFIAWLSIPGLNE